MGTFSFGNTFGFGIPSIGFWAFGVKNFHRANPVSSETDSILMCPLSSLLLSYGKSHSSSVVSFVDATSDSFLSPALFIIVFLNCR